MLHIIISVKDFKNIVAHASIMDTEVTTSYSHPSKPMQIKYGDETLRSEFILMTLGEYRGASATPQPAANAQAQAQVRARPVPRQLQQPPSMGIRPPPTMSMGPPPSLPRSATANVMQQTPNVRMPPTPASHKAKPLLEEDSLFVDQGDPEEDEDQQWNPTEEDEEMLGWDASAVYVRHSLRRDRRRSVLTIARRKTRELSLLPHGRDRNPFKKWLKGKSRHRV